MIVTTDSPPNLRLVDPAGWRITWALGIAHALSEAADCTRRRVGAVILDPRSWHILGQGYNGLAPSLRGCATAGACPRGQRSAADVVPLSSYGPGAGSCGAWHAEANAIADARRHSTDVADALLVVTDEPCPGCRERIAEARIGAAVWPGGTWEPTRELQTAVGAPRG